VVVNRLADASLLTLSTLAQRAAEAAGKQVLAGRPPVVTADAKSSPMDLVTDMDRSAERIIAEIISSERPDDSIVSEEGCSKRGGSGVEWIIDPIDGTTNYVRGLPHYAVSIAVAVHGRVEVGAVYDPSADEMFAAIRGGGATLNQQSICCAQTAIDEAIVATGFSYAAAERAEQGALLADLLPAIGDIRRPGSAALSICWVAAGRVDAFYERGLNPWDFEAGALIASEAGASVSGLRGRPASRNFVLVCAPSLAVEIERLLQAQPADSSS
jgi:myo-inositol-1(or 4)-monophosphatase